MRATTSEGPLTVRSTLVVGADGRGSVVRERAGLKVEDIGAPIDVLWMRLTRRPSDGAEPLGRMGAGKIFVMIDRGDYWQCAYVIAKGAAEEIKAKGLDAFRAGDRRSRARRCTTACRSCGAGTTSSSSPSRSTA